MALLVMLPAAAEAAVTMPDLPFGWPDIPDGPTALAMRSQAYGPCVLRWGAAYPSPKGVAPVPDCGETMPDVAFGLSDLDEAEFSELAILVAASGLPSTPAQASAAIDGARPASDAGGAAGRFTTGGAAGPGSGPGGGVRPAGPFTLLERNRAEGRPIRTAAGPRGFGGPAPGLVVGADPFGSAGPSEIAPVPLPPSGMLLLAGLILPFLRASRGGGAPRVIPGVLSTNGRPRGRNGLTGPLSWLRKAFWRGGIAQRSVVAEALRPAGWPGPRPPRGTRAA
jgi:hypothetical protein